MIVYFVTNQKKENKMSSWHSYTEIFNLGHKAVQEIFLDDVLIEEKVDGSQLSFGMIDGTLHIRSKGREFDIYACDDMFKKACETVLSIADKLTPGWTYRGEYLSKPKHNSLCYDRTPIKNIILFDINIDQEAYISYNEKLTEANRLGLECVPLLFSGKVENLEQIRALLDNVSVLGGNKIEGFVVKNYNRFTVQKKAMFGKYVSEAFKEVHRKEWKEGNPTQGDIILRLSEEYKTPARWDKAIQHLREAGQIKDMPEDIGPLMAEIGKDTLKECEDEIKEKLFQYAWKHISRNLTRGFPEYYKKKLLEQQFNREQTSEQEYGPSPIVEFIKDKILKEEVDKVSGELIKLSPRKCLVCGGAYLTTHAACENGHTFYDEANMIDKVLNEPDKPDA